MVQAAIAPLSFEAFLETCPTDGSRYELVNGQIREMVATLAHDDIGDFICDAFRNQVRQYQFDYKVTRFASVKTRRDDGLVQGRTPDVSVIDKTLWTADPKAYSALEEPIQLAVEVTSNNWRDDYLYKLAEYEALGVLEYWIVDYLAIGAARYIGSPQQPTISIYQLVEAEYHLRQFQGDDLIISPTFPDLDLAAADVFSAAGS